MRWTTGAVVFDLDGTLVDSLADIASAGNAGLRALGLPPHPRESYAGFAGHGLDALIERALGDRATPHLQATLRDRVSAHYHAHSTDSTRPYAGITDLLDVLESRRYRLGIVSNKPDPMTQRIVSALFKSRVFGFITGERSGIPRKPNPEGILAAARALDVCPAHVLYVGDTPVDVEAARRAGARSVAVAWGFRPRSVLEAARPDHLIDQPDHLLRCLELAPDASADG